MKLFPKQLWVTCLMASMAFIVGCQGVEDPTVQAHREPQIKVILPNHQVLQSGGDPDSDSHLKVTKTGRASYVAESADGSVKASVARPHHNGTQVVTAAPTRHSLDEEDDGTGDDGTGDDDTGDDDTGDYDTGTYEVTCTFERNGKTCSVSITCSGTGFTCVSTDDITCAVACN